MQATPEQYAAIHKHDKNLIVVAGAGSGKTRVLVERFLQLLEQKPDWEISALVAITFTRAAAYEMRHRLRLELERRATGAKAAHWARHLAGMDSARIDTIHGLCVDIIRANAAQAGVDPMFEVLDETEAAIMLDEAVEDVLAQIDAPSASLFAHYDSFRIEGALKQMSLIHADYPPAADPELIMAGWSEDWAGLVFAERERLLGSSEAQALESVNAPVSADKLADLAARYRHYLGQIARTSEAETVARLLREAYAKGTVGNKGSAKAWGGREAKREAAKRLRELRARVKAALDAIGDAPGEADRLTARLLPLWHELLDKARQLYRERKLAAALLDFDDLERLAAELLKDERARCRYRDAEVKHLLVDEFQDTNAAQWQIIRALVDLERGGSLFAVGDPKQSIYQFRGADVSVFNQVARQLGEKAAGEELPLSVSFRSHDALVRQFNALFARLFAPDGGSPVADYQVDFGKAMTAARLDSPDRPAIEFQLLDRQSLDAPDGKRASAADMRRWEAQAIAERVMSLVADGQRVYDKAERQWRRIAYGDIAILFQSMSHLTIYEEALKARQLPYLTLAGRGYYNRQEVWDMLELLRFLHNPGDDLALATVLRSPLFGFSDDLLLALRLTPAGEAGAGPLPLWEALNLAADAPCPSLLPEDAPQLRYALATLSQLLGMSGRVTISELLRRALELSNYAAILTGLPDGDRRRGNLEKLLRLARDSGKISLGKFSRYLADLTAREAREGEAQLEASQAIRLMTAHASKGLEFPLVILADASWQLGRSSPPTLLADEQFGLSCQVYDEAENRYVNGYAHRRGAQLQALKEAEERKRLLYVAATRAQDCLIISGQVRRDKAGDWTSRGWLRQLIEILALESLPSETEQRIQLAGLPVLIRMPNPPPDESLRAPQARADLWDYPADSDAHPPQSPPLMAALPKIESPSPSHISVSQLMDIGAYRRGLSQRQRNLAAQRFRQSIAGSPPADMANASHSQADNRRLVGEIVHELLRYPDIGRDERETDRLIQAVAWEKGLKHPQAARQSLGEVNRLLRLSLASQAYSWIRRARADSRPVYTELPFIFRRHQRVIHGVMDAVLQRHDGHWIIIDYKTSLVAQTSYEAHAQRYLLQLGIYAEALRVKLDLPVPPLCYVHYIRGSHTVQLEASACQAELRWLDRTIDELTGDDDATL